MRLLIAGDFYPSARVADLFVKGDYASVLSSVKEVVSSADLAVVNLECPVGGSSPISKVGPALQCGKETLDALKYAGFGCVTLANNHIRDFGAEGVKNTLDKVREYSLDSVGAGVNATEAAKVLVKEAGGIKVAIINCCEREFSLAGPSSPGACALDPVAQFHAIRKAREVADKVVVIVHGGYERCPFPSPRMVSTYRFFIDAGADAVVNHHQHCFSGYEVYDGRPIFYGLGNFCFDPLGEEDRNWHEGYMVELSFGKDAPAPSFKLIPYTQCDGGAPSVRLMDEVRSRAFFERIASLNDVIIDSEALRKAYDGFLAHQEPVYSRVFAPTGKIARLLEKAGIIKPFLSGTKRLLLKDYIDCDSHREGLTRYLGTDK